MVKMESVSKFLKNGLQANCGHAGFKSKQFIIAILKILELTKKIFFVNRS